MKIIGGQFKGRNFFMPNGLRATQNIVRESFFDVIGQDLEGITFLDLFSGSGAMGLEALSRGAEFVAFVEKNPQHAQVIEENIGLIEEISQDSYQLIQLDVFAQIKQFAAQKKTFDVIFADPPYNLGLAKKALKTLGAYDIVQPHSLVIIQHDKQEILPQTQGRFLHLRQRKFGSTILDLYKCQDVVTQ